MKNKFQVGDIVFSKSNPAQKLIVCEAINGYYCKSLEGPIRAPQIRFEKELLLSNGLPVLSPHKPKPLAAPFKREALMKIWRKTAAKVEV